MSSKPTEPRSIAAQLVLLFTPATALLLLCGLGVLYWIVVQHAFEEDNAVLADKIATVRADLHETGVEEFQQELQATRVKDRAGYFIRVLDSDGRAIAESPRMQAALPPTSFPSAGTNSKPRDVRLGGKLFSLATATAETGGRAVTVQIAQDRSGDDRFLRNFGWLTAAMLAGGIVAAALIAISVARRGLRPLAQMRAAVERIEPSHLAERLDATRWPLELRPLAAAFDAMVERLETSFTRLSQFSADLAHELRTPIANMIGEAQVALTRSRSPDEYRAVVESSVAECERLSAIVDNLLFLARAEAAEPQVQRERFDARAAVQKLAAYYSTLAEERHITIRCEGNGEIVADRLLFDRALTNLLDNALRFAPDGGEIAIYIEAAVDGATSVRIQDNGPGIPAEHLAHVFERFYRVDASRSSTGTGLGLALVKSIAQLHGGSALIESEPGRGTSVRLIFPAGSDSARAD
jgi:two-component system heavy metal sensor histidine kinase CusS